MYVLESCEPQNVFKYFEEISRIPRGSGNEKAISDYIYAFASSLGLITVQDERMNLVIKKPATKGYEDAPTVIIQGHVDMVCEKNIGTEHDFLKDPLDLLIDGDFITANGTTLGADNGIAVAYAMALLESTDIEHPALEVVLTTDEEVGMNGAIFLSPELLSGKIFINLDSGEEGELLSSCAGGAKTSMFIKGEYSKAPPMFKPYLVRVYGLKGGHSGIDIDKERGNSNIILGRVLNDLFQNFDLYLQRIDGGEKDNAIPRESEMVIWVHENEAENLKERVAQNEANIKNEYRISDSNLKISIEKLGNIDGDVFDKETVKKIILILLLTPNGVDSMSVEIENLVETSNNLGVIRTIEKEIKFTSAIRSAVATKKEAILEKLKILAESVDGTINTRGDYPAWEYSSDSKIRTLFADTYKQMYDKEAKIAAVHAGLECGVFAEKIDGADMISLGPDMFGIHTPEEKLSISSTKRTWEFLLEVLAKIK